MYIKIQTSPLSNGNTGSCTQLVKYLEKENEKKLGSPELFFSQNREYVFSPEVIQTIDSKKQGLRKDEAKFYSLVIAPSEQELEHIGNSKEALKSYTHSVMESYAENFNKGLNSQDLVWFAKIENERAYKGLEDIPEGKKQGDLKEGLQTHIHVVVSRKTADNAKKISPLANQRGTEITTGTGLKVTSGFDRDKFVQKCEDAFDKQFQYERPVYETYEYYKKNQLERDIILRNWQKQEQLYNFSVMEEQIRKMQKQRQINTHLENSKEIKL